VIVINIYYIIIFRYTKKLNCSSPYILKLLSQQQFKRKFIIALKSFKCPPCNFRDTFDEFAIVVELRKDILKKLFVVLSHLIEKNCTFLCPVLAFSFQSPCNHVIPVVNAFSKFSSITEQIITYNKLV